MSADDLSNHVSPWPHRWAVVLACATFPLLWVGGLVTTTDAGMAVPDWPTTYGYNLFLYPWTTWFFGPWDLFIEHGHRLLGATIGVLTICLLAVLWRCENRGWVRWMGTGALVLVCFQGALGGARVLLGERTLAMIHGCVGPLFFALTVALAVVTSRRWREWLDSASSERPSTGPLVHTHARVLQWLATLTLLLAYAQLVLGASVRHVPAVAEPSVFATAIMSHLTLAGVLTLFVAVVLWIVQRHFRTLAVIHRFAVLLAVLLVVQLCLGAGAWVVKYSPPRWLSNVFALDGYRTQAGGLLQTHVVTAHVATGSLILAASLVLALYAHRLVAMPRTVSRESMPDHVEVAV